MSELLLTGIKILTPLFLEKIKNIVNPSVLEKAIKKSVSAAQDEEKKQLEYNRLFFKSEIDLIPYFLGAFFHRQEVIEELQKPLINRNVPDTDILVESFNKVSKQYSKIKPQQNRIEPWIKKFIEVYFDETVSIIYKVSRKKYLLQLSALYDDIKFSGISVASQESLKSEKLSRIFVVPDVIEDEDLSISSGSDAGYIDESYTTPRRRFLATQIFSQSRVKRMILLGAPGAGKTILLSFLAVILTQENPKYHLFGIDANQNWLPIIVRIRDWVREPNYSLLDYIKYFAEKVLLINTLPTDFFEYWLNNGQALLLLDGLDEVSDVNMRSKIAEKITLFLHKYNHTPAIISSRPTGYRPSFFPKDEYGHFFLQPFDPPKIKLFVKKWYDSRFNNPSESTRWQENLKFAISQNDRIKHLATNPLLLTIITLVHRYEAYLPRHRHELYNRAVETLLTNWDTGKELNYTWPLKYLRRDSIRRLMERLAYWIHTHSDNQNSEGGNPISREDVLRQLSVFISEEDISLKRHEARAEADRFLQHIRERSGLLNEQGLGYYAFVHKTFQEYLTTQEIRDRQEESFDTVTGHISTHLHDSHWREVLLMLVAQQKRKNSERVLEEILKYLDPYEDILNRTIFFSVSCLAEDVIVQNSELVDHILVTLVNLDTSEQPTVTSKIRSEIYKVVASLSGTRYSTRLFYHYLNRQDSLDPIKFLKYKALLGDRQEDEQVHRQEAISNLILLSRDQDCNVRSRCADALGDLEDKSQTSIDTLVQLLGDNEPRVRASAAVALGNLENASPPVLDALILLLQDKNIQVHSSVIEALSRLAYVSEDIKQYLQNSLMFENPEISYRIVDVLSNVGYQSERISEYLLANLKVDGKIHERAAEAVGKVGDKQVIDKLLKMLVEDNPILRSRAIEALGRLGVTSDNVLASLSKYLSDKNVYVSFKAIEALERLGYQPEPLVKALLKLLQSRELCSVAIATLGRIKVDSDSRLSEIVVSVLREFIFSRDMDLRSKAAEALGNLGDESIEVVSTLLGNLEDSDPDVRDRAIELLGSLGRSDNLQLIETLLGFLGDDSKGKIVSSILGRIGNNSKQVMDILEAKLQDSNPFVGCNAAATLIQLGMSKEIILDTLLNLLESPFPAVYLRAAAALGQLGRLDVKVSDSIADWIRRHENHENVGQAVDVLWDLVAEGFSSESRYRVS